MLEKYLLKNTRAKVGLFILLFFALVAVFAPLIAPYQPKDISFMPWEKPSLAHPLGVNSYGQDIFSQVVYGTQVTMSVGVLAGLLTSFIGIFVRKMHFCSILNFSQKYFSISLLNGLATSRRTTAIFRLLCKAFFMT